MIELDEILKIEPTLTAFGIEGPKTYHTKEAISEKQIQICIDWLQTIGRSKYCNPNISSYGYKHMVEKDMGQYVSNGNFIAAVIYMNIPYKRIADSPNIHFVKYSK